MWMSYRYCIGRHTIASHMHATDIWQNCKGNRSKDDWCVTYIVDGCFGQLYAATKEQYPKELQDRIKVI